MRGSAAVFAWLLCGSAALAGSVVDRVAAVVDDEVISLSELYELGGPFIADRCPAAKEVCVHEAELEVLESLILRALMSQELRQLGLDITDEELDRTIDQIGRDYGMDDREQLRTELERQGMSWDVYREQLSEQLRQMKFQEAIIRPRISVSDEELLDLYQRSSRDFETPSEAVIEAITLELPETLGETALVEIVTAARALVAQLEAGEITWEDALAEHHSGAVVGKDGKMPPVKQGDLMPALDKVVFDTEAGKVAQPVVVPEVGVVFIVRVVEYRQSGILPFEEAKDALRDKMYEDKIGEQVEQWYQQAKRKAAVRVLIEAPAE